MLIWLAFVIRSDFRQASWADEWQLPVSVSKCSILTVGRVYDRIRYHLNGTELPQSNICRDLGVTITSDLSPSQHISEITLEAHQRANHIIRCFVSGDTHLLVRAFIVYVRPLLECNSDVSASFLCLSCPALVLVLIMCVSSCSVDLSK